MWWITAAYLEELYPQLAEKPAYHKDSEIHPVKFDKTKHRSFCAELKMLYTIITRAKRYVWIYEDFEPEKLPMLDFWYKRELIEVIDQETKSLDHTVSLQSSSSSEWKERGNNYMEKKLWRAAALCFKKANEELLRKTACARALEKQAVKSKQANISQLRTVADMYIKCYRLEHRKQYGRNAAICLYRAKMYSESIQLFEMIEEVSFKLVRFKWLTLIITIP